MDEAPFLVDAGVVDQPAHRTRAQRGDAVLDFLDLLGGVDVDEAAACERNKFGEFFGRHGAKAVRGDPDRLSRRLLDHPAAILDETRE